MFHLREVTAGIPFSCIKACASSKHSILGTISLFANSLPSYTVHSKSLLHKHKAYSASLTRLLFQQISSLRLSISLILILVCFENFECKIIFSYILLIKFIFSKCDFTDKITIHKPWFHYCPFKVHIMWLYC